MSCETEPLPNSNKSRASNKIVSAILCIALSSLVTSAAAGPPFLSDDPDPTPHEHYEIYLFATAEPAKDDLNGAYGVDFNYGAGPDLQLTATVPVVYDRPDGGPFSSGLGNVELAAKFRVLHQESSGLNVAVFPRIFMPTDSDLGEHHTSFLLPVWVGRNEDSWSAFGGGGCALNRGDDSRNYCIAGAAYTRHVMPNLSLGGEVFHQTSDIKDGSASTILGVGATYDINEYLHVLGYWGSNIENRAENGNGVAYASILFTF